MKAFYLIITICIFNTSSILAQVDYSEFEGIEGTTVFERQYPFANIYDYQQNAIKGDSIVSDLLIDNIPEQKLMQKYADQLAVNSADTILFSIILKSRLSIEVNRQNYYYIEYKVQKADKKSDFQIAIFRFQNNSWIEIEKLSNELSLLKEIMMLSSVDLLFSLFSSEDLPDEPLINDLRPLVQNEKGYLDIKKLHEVLSNNQLKLSKYIDN